MGGGEPLADETVKLDIIVGAQDKATTHLKGINLHLEKLMGFAKNAASALARIGIGAGIAGASGLAAGFGLIGKAALDAAMAAETLNARIETAFGQKAAPAWLQWAKDFATKTPFERPEVVDTMVRLKANQLNPPEWMTLVGDWAAGMSRPMADAAEALADALRGEWERATELAVTRQQLVAAGAHANKAGEIQRQTPEDTQALQTALKTVLSTNFAGGMARQMQTTAGKISNLKDAMTDLKEALGASLLPAFNQVVDWIAKNVGRLKTLATDWGSAIASKATEYATRALAWIDKFGPAFYEGLTGAWAAFLGVMRNVWDSLGLGGLSAEGIGAAIATSITNALKFVADLTSPGGAFAGAIASLRRTTDELWRAITEQGPLLRQTLINVAYAVENLSSVLTPLVQLLGPILDVALFAQKGMPSPMRMFADWDGFKADALKQGQDLRRGKWTSPAWDEYMQRSQSRAARYRGAGKSGWVDTIYHVVSLPNEWAGTQTARDLANNPVFSQGVSEVICRAGRSPVLSGS